MNFGLTLQSIGRKAKLLAASTVLLLAGATVGGIAVANASGTATTYYACLTSGNLSHVQTKAEACTHGHLISWDQKGVQGIQGMSGVNGTSVTALSTPPSGQCSTGNSAIDLTTGEVYLCVDSTWTDTSHSLMGATGPAGASGPSGPPGVQGYTGLNGASMIAVTSVPSGSCTTGDLAVYLTNGEVYSCIASTWTDSTYSLKGPAGVQGMSGLNGSSMLASTTVPSGSCTSGDTTVDITTGEVYDCVSSAWADSSYSLMGPAGQNGIAHDCSATPYGGIDLAQCVLSGNYVGKNFVGVNLTGANLNSIQVAGTSSNGSCLTYGSRFGGANLSDATAENVDFTCDPFVGANFSNADLTGANFTGARLEAANLNSVNLTGTNLTGTSFFRSYGYDINFTTTTLTNNNFGDASLPHSNFTGTNLSSEYFVGANLSGDGFVGANLSGANFTFANLSEATLVNAVWGNANLSHADLAGAAMSPDTGEYASVTWLRTTCPDGTLSDNDGGTCVNNLTP